MADRNTLGKTSVWVVVLLSVITGGVYQYLWFGLRRQSLQKLRTTLKISPGLGWTPAYLGVATFVAGVLTGVSEAFAIVLVPFASSWMIMYIFLSFRVRRMLLDHYQDSGLNISGVRTYFLSVFYLQYKMNRLPDIEIARPVLDKTSELYCAGVTTHAESEAEDSQLSAQATKLKHLKELLEAGLLTQAEFDAKRSEVFAEEKRAKLKRALDLGLLTQAEYELKEKELLGAEGIFQTRALDKIRSQIA